MHIKCANSISPAGVNGQKMQGTMGEKQTLCLAEILGRVEVVRICLLRQKFGQDMGINMPPYLHDNLHQNFNEHIQGLIRSSLSEHTEILVHYCWREREIDYRIHRITVKLAPSGFCLYSSALFVSKQKDMWSLIIHCL